MKVCVPTQEDKGTDSLAYGHFGSAPVFIIHDTDTAQTTAIVNSDQHHGHGACHPMQALEGRSVETVIVGGIGARAIQALNDMGIRVYRSEEGTVQANIDALKRGALSELTPDNACAHHGRGHGCAN